MTLLSLINTLHVYFVLLPKTADEIVQILFTGNSCLVCFNFLVLPTILSSFLH